MGGGRAERVGASGAGGGRAERVEGERSEWWRASTVGAGRAQWVEGEQRSGWRAHGGAGGGRAEEWVEGVVPPNGCSLSPQNIARCESCIFVHLMHHDFSLVL